MSLRHCRAQIFIFKSERGQEILNFSLRLSNFRIIIIIIIYKIVIYFVMDYNVSFAEKKQATDILQNTFASLSKGYGYFTLF